MTSITCTSLPYSVVSVHTHTQTHKYTHTCIHTTTTTQYKLGRTPMCLCTLGRKWASWHKKHRQCKLQVMNTMSANEVFALVDSKNTTSTNCRWWPPWVQVMYLRYLMTGKTPPVQVAGGYYHKCKWSTYNSWWQRKNHQHKLHVMTTMSVNNVLALVDDWKKHHQRKLQVKTILGPRRSRMQQPIAGSTRASSGVLVFCVSKTRTEHFHHCRCIVGVQTRTVM